MILKTKIAFVADDKKKSLHYTWILSNKKQNITQFKTMLPLYILCLWPINILLDAYKHIINMKSSVPDFSSIWAVNGEPRTNKLLEREKTLSLIFFRLTQMSAGVSNPICTSFTKRRQNKNSSYVITSLSHMEVSIRLAWTLWQAITKKNMA